MFLDVNNVQIFHTTLYAASQLRIQLHRWTTINSTGQKFRNITIFNGFELSLFCSPRLDLFDQKYRGKKLIL